MWSSSTQRRRSSRTTFRVTWSSPRPKSICRSWRAWALFRKTACSTRNAIKSSCDWCWPSQANLQEPKQFNQTGFVRYYFLRLIQKSHSFEVELIKEQIELYKNVTFNVFKLSQQKNQILSDAFSSSKQGSLLQAQMCHSCGERNSVVLIFPCLHLVLCVVCSTNYRKREILKDKKCVVCKEEIQEFFDLTMKSKINQSKCRIF